jgi:hypothetical protein
MTFEDVRKIALAWPEVEDGACYGTPALKVRKNRFRYCERCEAIQSQRKTGLLHRQRSSQ